MSDARAICDECDRFFDTTTSAVAVVRHLGGPLRCPKCRNGGGR